MEALNNVNSSFMKVQIVGMMSSCRVCMTPSLDMSCIFDSEKKNILEKIQFCTGVKMDKEDGLPSKICNTCNTDLLIAYKFKSRYLLADKTFRTLLESSVTKEKQVEMEEYCQIDNKDDVFSKIELDDHNLDNEVDNSYSIKKENRTSTKSNMKKEKRYTYKKMYCETCNIKFKTKSEYDSHKKDVHGDENWVCEICGKQFVHRSSHYAHIRSHMPPKYICDHCNYKTWHKSDLIKHIRIHTGIKTYGCVQCAARFRNASNLRGHERRRHGAAPRPHRCHLCARAFYDTNKLRRHIDTHNNIKRYECEVCLTCFSRRYHWKQHLARAHGMSVPAARPGPRKRNLVLHPPSGAPGT